MRNGDYWNGLEMQLTSYLTSDECDHGWFLAVRFSDSKTEVARTQALASRTRAASAATGFKLRSDWVDARWKKSASELNPNEPRTRESPPDPESEAEE